MTMVCPQIFGKYLGYYSNLTTSCWLLN